MRSPLPLAAIIVAALAMNGGASDETNLVYISDKISPPAASGNTDVRLATIAPDGTHAVYVQSASDSSPVGTLYSVPVSGGNPIALLGGISRFQPLARAFQSTPDGQHVIGFREGPFPTGDIFAVPITGGQPIELGPMGNYFGWTISDSGGGYRVPFIVSPDSSVCAFINEAEQLTFAPIDGSSATVVSEPFTTLEGVAFSPDSQTFYFIGDHPQASRTFYSVPTDGSEAPSILFVEEDGTTPAPVGYNSQLLPSGTALISITGTFAKTTSIQKFILGNPSPTTILQLQPPDGAVATRLSYDPTETYLFAIIDSNQFGDKTLHFVDLEAGTQTALRTQNQIYDPVLSPDGSSVAYGAADKFWSQPIDGSNATCLTDHPTAEIDALSLIGFSSDSSRVAFRGQATGNNSYSIYSNTLDGSNLTRLNLPLPEDRYLGGLEQISTDGTHLFYLADLGTTPEDDFLYRVPIAGGDSQLMNTPGAPGGDVDILIQNPDGSGFAFVADLIDNAIDELFYRRYDATEETILSERGQGESRITNFEITADSLFAVYRAQQFTPGIDELAIVPTTGGTPRRLNQTPVLKGDVDRNFKLSPDSKHVVFVGDMDTNTVTELYSVPLAGGDQKKLHPDLSKESGSEIAQFKISPDSRHVVFLADIEKNRRSEIYLSAIDGSFFRRISPDFTGGDAGPLEFSPDGNFVVFDSPDDSTPESTNFFVHDIAANTTTQHPAGRVATEILFSPDSQHLAFRSISADRQLTLTSIAGDILYDLGSNGHGATWKAFTADSMTLWHVDSERTTVFATDTSTGVTTELYRSPNPIQQFHAHPFLNYAIIQTAEAAHKQIITIPTDGTPPTIAHTASPISVIGPFATAPDGHDILFSVDATLWMHTVSGPTSAENVSNNYELTGTYTLLPGGNEGFFIGRPAGTDQTPGMIFIDPNEDDGPTVIPVRPIPQQGSGPQNSFRVSRDGRQVFYISDHETNGFRELYAATTGTCLTTSTSDDALESDGTTDTAALESQLASGNFTGLRFNHLEADKNVEVYSAHLTVTASSDRAGLEREVAIKIQDDANPTPFVGGATPDISTRPTIADTTTLWQLGDWTTGQTYTTPDISQLFQNLFAKPDWQTNNPAVLTLSTPLDTDSFGPDQFFLYDSDPSAAPTLELILRSDRYLGPLERLGFTDWANQQGQPNNHPDQDPDGDGLSLAIEYALGLDPNNPDPSPALDLQLYPKVSYIRDQRRTSANISLELSTDLKTWKTLTTSTQGSRSTQANEITTQNGKIKTSITLAPQTDGEPTTQYLRLRVTIQ